MIALVIGFVALATGRMPPQRAAIDPATVVISHDFAALGTAGASGAAVSGAPNGSERPDLAETTTAPSQAPHCAGSTWPYFDKDCLWGNGEESTPRRRRIVLRLKSPWCSGLISKEGAYLCRRRA